MKLNKLFQALSILSFASISPSIVASPFDGFYVGLSVGGSSTNATQDQIVETVLNTTLAGAPNIDVLHIDGPNGLKADNFIKGALYAGFGSCWDYWYLGVEVFADVSRYKNRNSEEVDTFETLPNFVTDESQASTHAKLDPVQFGIDLRPGFLLTPNSMFYGRIGAAFAELNVETSGVFAGQFVGPAFGEFGTFNIFLPISEKRDRVGLRLGAGIEKNLCPRLNGRLDYIYTYYGKNEVSGLITDPNVVVTMLSTTSVKVYNNSVMLGFSYLIK